jgi:SulP family sulfate permease
MLPTFEWPWLQPGPNGKPLQWNFANVRALVSAALAIAMLGAIESLLCAVVLDGLTGKRHSANSELLGQGIGNLIAPFWGGFTATAALARSATNVKAGAESPVAAIIHSLVVLLGLVLLAPLLAYLPMASMAALLLVVAWNMSEVHKVVKLLRRAPMGDVLVLLICLSLTVLFDMVIAIGVGIVLAALMFMRDLAGMIRVADITDNRRWLPTPLPPEWCVVKISGPLFFAAADRVFGELSLLARQRMGLIVVMEAVPLLDAGGLASMEKLIDQCSHLDVQLIFAELQFQPLKTLSRAGLQPVAGKLAFTATLEAAVALVTEPRWPENAA